MFIKPIRDSSSHGKDGRTGDGVGHADTANPSTGKGLPLPYGRELLLYRLCSYIFFISPTKNINTISPCEEVREAITLAHV